MEYTPCEDIDENGHHHCPYEDTYMGSESEMCRNCCGLGVDEERETKNELYK